MRPKRKHAYIYAADVFTTFDVPFDGTTTSEISGIKNRKAP
jgi:hypothetical protein